MIRSAVLQGNSGHRVGRSSLEPNSETKQGPHSFNGRSKDAEEGTETRGIKELALTRFWS